MAWTTSATNRKAVCGARSFQFALLVVHLSVLVAMVIDRSSGDSPRQSDHAAASLAPELVTAPGAAASLALLTGLALLVLLTLTGRSRTQPPLDGAAAYTGRPAIRHTLDRSPAIAAEAAAHAGLIARLNHDLRTPLNAILGFADLMRSETFGPLGNDRYRAYAAHMQSCGLDLLRATESTLAIAALITGPRDDARETFGLAAVIREAWPLAEKVGESEGGRCTLDLAVDPALEVRGERTALRESLVNLLVNARLRAVPGGRVTVGATRSHGRVDATIDVAAAIAGSHRTGCHARGAGHSVDELALGLSRTLLGLDGITLVETCNRPDRWTVALTLEDAAQSDLFAGADKTARPVRGTERAGGPQGGYLAGVSPSRSA